MTKTKWKFAVKIDPAAKSELPIVATTWRK